jgi:hypothetical protein
MGEAVHVLLCGLRLWEEQAEALQAGGGAFLKA